MNRTYYRPHPCSAASLLYRGLKTKARLFSLAILILLPASAIAQSGQSYVYPGTSGLTQFTVGNVNPGTVTVSVSYFGLDGDESLHTIVLGPGRQTRFTGESALGLTNFTGTTVITAALPVAVTATLVEETSFEHIRPAEPDTDLVIPLAASGGSATAVSIFNPGDIDARVRIVLVGADGSQLGFRDRTAGPKQTITETVTSDATEYVVIRTGSILLVGRPVAAAALIVGFTPPGDVGGQRVDAAHVTARPIRGEGTATRIPLYVQGDGFFSTIQVINNANSPQTVTLTALELDGTIVGGSNNPATIELAGRGAHTEAFDQLFDLLETGLVLGSISVEGTDTLSAGAAIGNVTEPSVAILLGDTTPTDAFAYHTRRVGREFFLGLNLINPSTSDAELDLSFVLDDGTAVSRTTLILPGSTQLTQSLAAMFPEATGNGFVYVRSSVPILAGGLEGRADQTTLAPLEALPASANFVTPEPTKRLAVGTVLLNGSGLSDVGLLLTGPLVATTVTDLAGTYRFPDLPPGSYRLTAEAIGFVVSPAERTFVIADGNSRNNDFEAAFRLPSITTLSPNGVPAGSAATEILLEGGPFIPSSRVFLETTELPTTFVSSGLLSASIGAELLEFPLDSDLFVRNTGPADSFMDSASVSFRVGTSPARIDRVSGQPSPIIAGSPAFTLTAEGSGFIPGVTILAGEAPQSTTFVSDTEVRATISAEALSAGGFLSIAALNPGPAVRSNAVVLSVLGLPATITGISPGNADVRLQADVPPMTLFIDGTGFQEGAVVLMDSAAVSTTFVSATRLIAAIPAALLSQSGIRKVQARNPEPSLAPSFGFPLVLTSPKPVLSSLTGTVTFSPARTNEIQTVPVLFDGGNFVEDSVAWAAAPCDTDLADEIDDMGLFKALDTTRLTPERMLVLLRVGCAGTYLLQIRSPQPGGGVSETLTLTVAGDQ